MGTPTYNHAGTMHVDMYTGGNNDFNYEFLTLLIQTFAHDQQLAARLST